MEDFKLVVNEYGVTVMGDGNVPLKFHIDDLNHPVETLIALRFRWAIFRDRLSAEVRKLKFEEEKTFADVVKSLSLSMSKTAAKEEAVLDPSYQIIVGKLNEVQYYLDVTNSVIEAIDSTIYNRKKEDLYSRPL